MKTQELLLSFLLPLFVFSNVQGNSPNCSSNSAITTSVFEQRACGAQLLSVGVTSNNWPVYSTTDSACFGDNDASITVSPSGGIGPSTYNWSPVGANTLTISSQESRIYTNLPAEPHTELVTIAEPTELTLGFTINQQIYCNGGTDGIVTANAGGGTPGYLYLWGPSAGSQTTMTASNLPMGTHTLIVTDANSSTETASVTIAEPSLLTATAVTISNPSCFGGSDGSVMVSVTGGTTSYTYTWDDVAATGQNPTGLSAGTYTVTVTDGQSCTATASAGVFQPDQLTVAAIGSSLSCNGDADGTINVTVTGGTTNYTYTWDTAATGSNPTGLNAGIYTVTVTDAQNCTTTASAEVTELDLLSATATGSSLSCIGDANGTIAVTVTGGTTSYTYIWNNAAATGSHPTGLNTGIYTVTVIDAQNCTTTASAEVTEPDLLSATATGSSLSCNGDGGGTIAVTVTGGTTSYTYIWDNAAATGSNPTGLNAGIYTVTVTDAQNCTTTASAEVTEQVLLSATATGSSLSCNGDADGTIAVTVTGGTTSYTYIWDNAAATGSNPTGLNAGIYTVTVTDANGCEAITSAEVIVPTNISISAIQNSTNSATASAVGGTSPYTLEWQNGEIGMTAINLTEGLHTLTVTDANNCTETTSINIFPTVFLSTSSTTNTPSCNGASDGIASASSSGGVQPYNYLWNTGETSATITGLASGEYSYTVTDTNNDSATNSVTVSDPPPYTPALLFMSSFPSSNTISCANSLWNFTINNYGQEIYTRYAFFKNGILEQDSASDTYTTTEVENGDLITGEAYDTNGCTYLVVNNIIVNAFISPEISICNPTTDSLQVMLTQGSPPWSFELLSFDEENWLNTINYTVYSIDTTLTKVLGIRYEVSNLGLSSDACIYNDSYNAGEIVGCTAICVGYSTSYIESYTAFFPDSNSNVTWSVDPPDALTNGDVQIVGGQNSTTVSLDFSNPNPTFQQITLLANTPTCDSQELAFPIILDPGCVWPGDVNHDGQVDIYTNINYIDDEIALEFGRTYYNAYRNNQNGDTLNTFLRPSGCLALETYQWEPQSAQDWLITPYNSSPLGANFPIKDANGNITATFNLKYADCNGNGEIETTQTWNPFLTPFSALPAPSDHDIIVYQAISERKHNGNESTAKQNNNEELIRIVSSQDTITNGDQVVFTALLGSDSVLIENVRHIVFIGEGEFGTYKRPELNVMNSHLSKGSTSKLVDYPFLNESYDGVENDSLRWYVSLGRPENLSYGVDFEQEEEICKLVCHVIVAGVVANDPFMKINSSNEVNPVTFDIPAAGILLESGEVIYTQSQTATIWVRPNPILNTHLFLEGPYDPTTNLMRDDLRLSGLIPATEPFSSLGFDFPNYDVRGLQMTDSMAVLSVSGQDAIVDWVFIEVRDKLDPSIVISARPGLLTRHGDIVDMDGKSAPRLWHTPHGEYYVAIKTRNHIAAMTAQPVLLNDDNLLVDFVQTAAYNNGTKLLPNGLFALNAGDANGDGIVNAADRSETWNDRNREDYIGSDCNMDGIVNAADRSITWNSRNIEAGF